MSYTQSIFPTKISTFSSQVLSIQEKLYSSIFPFARYGTLFALLSCVGPGVNRKTALIFEVVCVFNAEQTADRENSNASLYTLFNYH